MICWKPTPHSEFDGLLEGRRHAGETVSDRLFKVAPTGGYLRLRSDGTNHATVGTSRRSRINLGHQMTATGLLTKKVDGDAKEIGLVTTLAAEPIRVFPCSEKHFLGKIVMRCVVRCSRNDEAHNSMKVFPVKLGKS